VKESPQAVNKKNKLTESSSFLLSHEQNHLVNLQPANQVVDWLAFLDHKTLLQLAKLQSPHNTSLKKKNLRY
jgi:hypothetical protein